MHATCSAGNGGNGRYSIATQFECGSDTMGRILQVIETNKQIKPINKYVSK